MFQKNAIVLIVLRQIQYYKCITCTKYILITVENSRRLIVVI